VDTDSLDKDVYLGRPAPLAKCKTVIFPLAFPEVVAAVTCI